MNFGELLFEEFSEYLILAIDEARIPQVIILVSQKTTYGFVFVNDASDDIKDHFVIENLQKTHRQEIHALTVTDLRKFNGESFENVEKRIT